MTPQLIRFAAIDNAGASKQVLYNVPAGTPLQNMFQGGAKFRLTGSVGILIAPNRALPFLRTSITFGYAGADAVTYYDADEASTLNKQVSSNQWLTYFTADQSYWIEMPPGQIQTITCLWTPPLEYTFTPGDEIYYFATMEVVEINSDPFKRFVF